MGRLRDLCERPPGPRSALRDRRDARSRTNLGWAPKYKFEQAIKTTVQWYKDNQAWWRAIKSGEYLKYYEAQYAGR